MPIHTTHTRRRRGVGEWKGERDSSRAQARRLQNKDCTHSSNNNNSNGESNKNKKSSNARQGCTKVQRQSSDSDIDRGKGREQASRANATNDRRTTHDAGRASRTNVRTGEMAKHSTQQTAKGKGKKKGK